MTPVIKGGDDMLTQLAGPVRATVASAHRTPQPVRKGVDDANIRVTLAGGGAAAHLAGVVAAHPVAPVIGVPVNPPLMGLDAFLCDETRHAPLLTVHAAQAETVLAHAARVEVYTS